MAQTPTQRLANKRYAQQEAKKMGSLRPPKEDGEVVRPKKSLAKKIQASPVPAWALYVLLFVLIGGLGLEFLRIFF